MDHVYHEGFFACHLTLDNSDEKDEDDLHPNARFCVGALIFMNQSGKMARNPGILQLQRSVPRQHPKVFRNRMELKQFHGK